jgi:predicted SpoU family rRNA methylase
MVTYTSIVFEYLRDKKCAKLEEIVRYVVERTGKKYSLGLHKDIADVVKSLVKQGVAVRIARGYYCFSLAVRGEGGEQ